MLFPVFWVRTSKGSVDIYGFRQLNPPSLAQRTFDNGSVCAYRRTGVDAAFRGVKHVDEHMPPI